MILLGLDRLWRETLGDPRIAIAVLDGPVDVAHPAFSRADLELVDAGIMPVAREGPAAEHGTHVAGVIFAGHGQGPLRGIAPSCRGVIIPVFADGSGGTIRSASQFDLARAIDLAMTRRVSVISISGGQFRPSGAAHPTLEDSVRECHRRGILIVAAAGNEGCDCLHVPAAMPSVMAVGAMDDEGRPLDFSNWGRAYADQGVLAPGQDVLGAAPGGGFVTRTGTSYATPIVAGIAGLLLSLQLRRGERPDVATVRSAILRGAVGCDQQPFLDCRRLLAGRLNVERSLTLITKGSASMSEAELVAQEGQVMASAVAQADNAEPTACTPGPAEVQPARSADVRPSPPSSAARPEFMAAGVAPSDCGCGGGNGKECTCGTKTQQLVKAYVIGQIGYDFATEARRDSFLQAMGEEVVDPQALLAYLKENPYEASRLTWTLLMESVPVYAIQAAGPYADVAYKRLVSFLEKHLQGHADLSSIPGFIAGTTALMAGQTVPVIVPVVRGMYNWTTTSLIAAVLGAEPPAERRESLQNFLDRVYYE
ncbi:MAG TPA: PatA/PatG family cyanobactin maturation protease, partial [Isosphaeraceae bacterium]|nr:PatA/PatG family cyanobactin maturation protease [Isosphaeraceae bacterium]